jgi:hypothetical protein
VLCHQRNPLIRRVLFLAHVGARWLVFAVNGHRMGTGRIREHMNRTEQAMLRAAMDFCCADADVQRRTILMRELRSLHRDTEVCYIPIKNELGEIIKKARPQARWCEHCRRFPPEAVDYSYASEQSHG